MSIVADVLASVRTRGVDRISVGIPGLPNQAELMKQSEQIRVDICQSLSSHYVALSAPLTDSAGLFTRVNATLAEVDGLIERIQQEIGLNLEGSVSEISSLVTKWKEVTGTLDLACSLLKLHQVLQAAEECTRNGEYCSAVEHTDQAGTILNELCSKELDEVIDVVSSIRDQRQLLRKNVAYKATEAWGDLISWREDVTEVGGKSVSLTFHPTGGEGEEALKRLDETLTALYLLGELQRRVGTLGHKVILLLVKPILTMPCEVTVSTQTHTHGDSHFLQLVTHKFQHIAPDNHVAAKLNPLDTLKKLADVFVFLSSSLVQIRDGTMVMNMLGEQIRSDFTDLLIRHCLSEAVPYHRDQLDQFKHVQDAVKELQEMLTACGFFPTSHSALLEYAANVDIVFANKACAHRLERARELVKRPAHVVYNVIPMSPDGPLIINENGETMKSSTHFIRNLFEADVFNFPKCQISASVCDIVELIYEILEEAVQSSPTYAGRLFYTVRNILSIYCHVAPLAHPEELATVPVHAALVHNSAMYLAHHALLLGHQYAHRLPAGLKGGGGNVTCCDLGHQLRGVATSVFLKAMQGHKSSLVGTLRESFGVPNIGCNVDISTDASRHMRQCLHQLELLHNVWQNVLPHSVFVKAVGTLLNSVIEEVLSRVLSLEDISADGALSLVLILTQLKENVPRLLQVEGEMEITPAEVARYVHLWNKFGELLFVLGGSLHDIQDRWAEGKGPLAVAFVAEEVRQLLRALFANTDRRAAVLATIR